MKYSKGKGAVCIVILLLLLDQILKIWIKTHLELHESIKITSWFYLYFTENPGMAFGIEVIGKLFLSIFRIVAVGFIGYYLYSLVKKNYPFGFIACVSLIQAGAIGNIIDSVFSKDVDPGAIVEIVPTPGSKVKEGRIVFVTINAKTSQMARIPEVQDLSFRQAYALLTSIASKPLR